MDYGSALNDARTNAVQSETGGDFRVSYESQPRLKPGPKRKPLDRLFGGSVYFIEAVGTDMVKIGYTCNTKDRLKKLQTASPHELRLVASCKASFLEEQRLHSRFAHCRVRGEWFERVPEIEAEIERLNSGCPVQVAVEAMIKEKM
jgi:hypothetical protein